MAADVTLDIELDPGPWSEPDLLDYYPAGSRLTGRVRVLTAEPIECRGVMVRVGWTTQGRGDEDSEDTLLTTLFVGTLPIGDSEYAFEIQLPPSPISYAGHYINIVWSIRAHLALAWKVDPTADRTIYVTPREVHS